MARLARGWATLSLLALAGCSPPAPEPGGDQVRVVKVLAFNVEGQAEDGGIVGEAFADSLAAALAQADGLQLAVPASPGVTHQVSGTLRRDDGTALAHVALHEISSDELIWEADLTADEGTLSSLASSLARQTADAMGLSYPDLYGGIDDLSVGALMATSSTWADAQNWRRFDTAQRVEWSATLVEQFPEEPTAHVTDAWALMLAWDATPSNETLLVRLKDRLAVLNEIDPTSPYDELFLSYVYRTSGEPDRSRELCSRMVGRTDLSPAARAWALRQRSLAFLQMGNAAAARHDAEEAARLDPINASSLIALSKSLETLGEYDQAIGVSERALTLQPYQWRHFQRLGVVLGRAQRFDEATEVMEQACRMSDSQEACANLAVTLERAGRIEDAKAAGAHAESLAGTPFGRYNLACYRALAGRTDAALDDLRRALDLGFADILIASDPDLESLRSDAAFEGIATEVRERVGVRRSLSSSVFPWQA